MEFIILFFPFGYHLIFLSMSTRLISLTDECAVSCPFSSTRFSLKSLLFELSLIRTAQPLLLPRFLAYHKLDIGGRRRDTTDQTVLIGILQHFPGQLLRGVLIIPELRQLPVFPEEIHSDLAQVLVGLLGFVETVFGLLTELLEPLLLFLLLPHDLLEDLEGFG